MRRSARAWCAAWGLLFGLMGSGGLGCEGLSPQEADRTHAGCVEDTDCPGSLRCWARACIGGASPKGSFSLRITPPHSSGYAPVELEDLRFSGAVSLALESPIPIPQAVRVSGQVVSADGQLWPTQVVASPGRGQRPALLSEGAESAGAQQTFDLFLAPWWPTAVGGSRQVGWDLRFAPQGLPPWRQTLLQVQPTEGVARFELPHPDSLLTLEGVVLSQVEQPSPLAGLEVRVLDAQGLLVSTVERTDTWGRFSVRLWPEAAGGPLSVRVRSVDDWRPLPTLTVAIPAASSGRRQSFEPVVAYMGALGDPFLAEGRVVGHDASGVERPVPFAHVRLRAPLGAGRFEVHTRTDEAGYFRTRAYAGSYLVDVEPSLDDTLLLRLGRRQVALSAQRPWIDVLLRNRSMVYGQVVDAADAPVAGALLSAQLVQARYGDARLNRVGEQPPSRRVSGQTSADGSFALALDPGVHDLSISPPPELGLSFEVQRLEISGAQARPVDVGWVRLSPAAVVQLRLVNAQGQPLPQAQVALWRGGRDPAPLAHARSDALGQVVLVMPNAPASEAR